MSKQIPEIILNDGLDVPAIGFGTYALNGNAGVQSIDSAIDVGYRFFVNDYNYDSESRVGEVVRLSTYAIDELLSTSKIPGCYHKYDLVVPTLHDSLYRANLDYYGLFLI